MFPADQIERSVSTLIGTWTRKDYQAAGQWLAATPDGPTKTIAIRSYAVTVAGTEPETAAQWAMTLPPGKDRDSTLKQIYENWPKSDPAAAAAAEAFAKLHDIK